MKLTAESTVINDAKINTDIDTAQTTANDAKTIADNTNQYFWFTSSGTDTGAHITEQTQAQFLANPSGGNLLARSNGIAVRDGTTEMATFTSSGVAINQGGAEVASFGASARIGKVANSESRVEIGDSSIDLVNRDSSGVDKRLSVKGNGNFSYIGTTNSGIDIRESTTGSDREVRCSCYDDSVPNSRLVVLSTHPTSVEVRSATLGGILLGVYSTSEYINIRGYQLKDFIIDVVTDGIWTCEKHKNGTYHAWYEGTINLGTTSSWGGGYMHQSSTAHTPPSFSTGVTSLVGACNGGARCAYMGHTNDYYTYWWNDTGGTTNNVPVRLDMYGTCTISPID